MNPDWDGIMRATAREPKPHVTIFVRDMRGASDLRNFLLDIREVCRKRCPLTEPCAADCRARKAIVALTSPEEAK